MLPAYVRALSRDDVSRWLVHFTTGSAPDGRWLGALDVVRSILASGAIFPSRRPEVTRYYPEGSTSFYDVSPNHYPQLLATNPNRRQPYGLIAEKTIVWWKGGRPAIYTDRWDPARWPEEDRFRVIATDLTRQPSPLDWTHEREWRFPGAFALQAPIPFVWWWPCVRTSHEAISLLAEFPTLVAVFAIESGVIERSIR